MRILFTCGGTAGHVTPNIALIRRLQKEGWQIDYIGSKDGIERELIGALPGVTYHAVDSGKLRRYFSWKNFTDPFRVIAGMVEARHIIKTVKPDVIFSKVGFVSVPVVMAAGKTPVVAHESDYTPGLANRIACRFADTVCVTFSDTEKHITGRRAVHTGTPIRPELYDGDEQREGNEAANGFALHGVFPPFNMISSGKREEDRRSPHTGARRKEAPIRAPRPLPSGLYRRRRNLTGLCGCAEKNAELAGSIGDIPRITAGWGISPPP